MEEGLDMLLERVSDGLHWLQRYTEANTIALLVRLLRIKQIRSLDELEKFMDGQEDL